MPSRSTQQRHPQSGETNRAASGGTLPSSYAGQSYAPYNPQHGLPVSPKSVPVVKEETTEEKIKIFFEKSLGTTPPQSDKRNLSEGELKTEYANDPLFIAETFAKQQDWSALTRLASDTAFFYPSLKNLNFSNPHATPENAQKLKNLCRSYHIHAVALVQIRSPVEALKILNSCDEHNIFLIGKKESEIVDVPSHVYIGDDVLDFAPFSMRVLRCSLESSVGNLYKLLGGVERVLKDGENGGKKINVDLWEKRRIGVVQKIAGKLKNEGKTSMAFKAIYDIASLPQHSCNLELQQLKIAYFLQTGLVNEASIEVQKLEENLPSTPSNQFVITYLKGLLQVSSGNYHKAEQYFSQNVQNSNNDVSSVNNKAICAVYGERLPDAVILLQKAIALSPGSATDAAAKNLCSMYEMMCENPTQKKARLLAVLEEYRGAHFAYSVSH